MSPVNDPNFQSSDVLEGVRVDIPDSPCGPIHVLGFGFDGPEMPLGAAGSMIVLPTMRSTIETAHLSAYVDAGCFACTPANAIIRGGRGIVIWTPDFYGFPQIGGPIELTGRLKYIDGCSDTVLVSPPVWGQPCLNHLHLPREINQTQHVHPSDRIGIILYGRGECRTPVTTHALKPGMFWRIPTGGQHSFHTADHGLDVMAWHPDSEYGPRHDDHPMLSRTIVDGDPANDERHRAIRTTEIRR